MTRPVIVYFEKAKSGLATATWLWLLLDTIIDPAHFWNYHPPNHQGRGNRIARVAISAILLLYVPP
jgi:hypothetical protein